MRRLNTFALTILCIILLSTTKSFNIDSERKLSRSKRVIGGEKVSKGDYPWAVSLMGKKYNSILGVFYNKQKNCGGALIDSKWVLTAAHCVEDLSDPKQWHVRLAQTTLTPSIGERIKSIFNRILNKIRGHDNNLLAYYHVDKIFIHPKYQKDAFEYDLALFHLKEDLELSTIRYVSTIDLPNNTWSSWPDNGQICTAVGWGCGWKDGQLQHKAQSIDLKIIKPQVCREVYKGNINLTTSHEFCAGNNETFISRGLCQGDSGSPLTCESNGRPVLAGIVTAIHRDDPGSFPAIFARVSYFIDWIYKTMAEDIKEDKNNFKKWLSKMEQKYINSSLN